MVALDDRGRPVEVAPVIAESPEEKRRMAAAKIRRSQRKVLEKALKQSADELAEPTPVSAEMLAGRENTRS